METMLIYPIVVAVGVGMVLRVAARRSRIKEPQQVVNALIGLLLLVPGLMASVQLGAEPTRPDQDGQVFVLVDEGVEDLPLCVKVTVFPEDPDQLKVRVSSLPGSGASVLRVLPAEADCGDFEVDMPASLAGKVHVFVTGTARPNGSTDDEWKAAVAEDVPAMMTTLTEEGNVLWRTKHPIFSSRNGRTVVRPPSVSVNAYYANSAVNFDVCPDSGAYCVKGIDSSILDLSVGSPGIDFTVDRSMPAIQSRPSAVDSTETLVWTSKRMSPITDKVLSGFELPVAGGTISSPEVKLVDQNKVDRLDGWRSMLIAVYGIGISISTGAVMSIIGGIVERRSTTPGDDLQL